MELDGIRFRRPIQYRYVDPVEGERTRPVQPVPPLAITIADTPLLFPHSTPKSVAVQVRANAPGQRGALTLRAGTWRVAPAAHEFLLNAAGDQLQFEFTVTPPVNASTVLAAAAASKNGNEVRTGMRTIAYPHIPVQVLLTPAARKLVRVDTHVLARRVGYVPGAGDQIPEALAQLGCQVGVLTPADLISRPLGEFDAIVTGVRAYSVRPQLRQVHARLLEYVHGGGTLITQYEDDLPLIPGPYPFRIFPRGRGRVTVESAPVKILKPGHPLLSAPNAITAADFENWVHERGLYFAETWDKRYETVLSSHDSGDEPLPGGMLYASYGKGIYIYILRTPGFASCRPAFRARTGSSRIF